MTTKSPTRAPKANNDSLALSAMAKTIVLTTEKNELNITTHS